MRYTSDRYARMRVVGALGGVPLLPQEFTPPTHTIGRSYHVRCYEAVIFYYKVHLDDGWGVAPNPI